MRRLTPNRVIILVLVVLVVVASYEYKVANLGAYQWPPPKIDPTWVKQFMANVSSVTGKDIRENASLDALAKFRFNTAVLVPGITHFGANTELPAGVGEVIYYPSGHSPVGFVQGVELESPIHWQIMASYGFTEYGYFLGQGPVAIVSESCQAPELSMPGVNITSFYAEYGCKTTWITSTWLVIDMSK